MNISKQEIVMKTLPWPKDKSNLLGIKGCFYGSWTNHKVPDYDKPNKWSINGIRVSLQGLGI